MRQLFAFFIVISILVPLAVLYEDLVLGSIPIAVGVGSVYCTFYWLTRPSLRQHPWKAPWMLGMMALGSSIALFLLDDFMNRPFRELVPLEFASIELFSVLLLLGLGATLIATPVRLIFPRVSPSIRVVSWARALLNAALVFGPCTLLLAWVFFASGLAELVVPNRYGLGVLVWFVITVIGGQCLALVLFAISAILQLITHSWLRYRMAACLLYGGAWLAYCIWHDYY